jgi:hypothetical protein
MRKVLGSGGSARGAAFGELRSALRKGTAAVVRETARERIVYGSYITIHRN